MPTQSQIKILSLEVTESCDKACTMCCMSAKSPSATAHMPFDSMKRLVKRLDELGVRNCNVGITGGEPFLYEVDGAELADIVAMVQVLRPRELYIQTSGIGPRVFDFEGQIERIKKASTRAPVKFATSYSMYQHPRIDEYFLETLEILSAAMAPEILEVHLTSDPRNRKKTLESFEKVIHQLSFQVVRLEEHASFCKRKDHRILGRLSSTVNAGRAEDWKDLEPETDFDNYQSECRWLTNKHRTMHILKNGNVYVCCDPRAYRNPTHIMNCFEEDPELFFKRYPSLQHRLVDVITTLNKWPKINAKCARCNLVDHRKLKFRQITQWEL